MKRLKGVRAVLGGTALISAIVAVAVLNYDSKVGERNSGSKTDRFLSKDENKVSAARLRENQSATLLEATEVYSTPSEHDQTMLSSALRGTNIDGALRADADGALILDIGLRDFFDYFLSVADEIGPENAISEIQRYATGYLPEPAKTQALNLLANYLRYKQAEFQLEQTPLSQSGFAESDALVLLKNSFEQLRKKRRSLFTQEQDRALFALEDAYANHTLVSLELMADETSSDQEKRERLAQLESALPLELSASFNETRAAREQQDRVESLLASERDDSQVYDSLDEQGLAQHQIDSILVRRQQQRQFESLYRDYSEQKRALDKSSVAYADNLIGLQKQFFHNPEDQTQARLRDLKGE